MSKAKKIRILDLRPITLAKVDFQGNFHGIGKAYQKLMYWVRHHGFTNSSKNKTLTIYYDDPNVVGINNVRQSACIIVDTQIESAGEITRLDFKPGKCAVGRFEISFFEFKDAWVEMHQWIRDNNLKITGKSFEVYQNNSNKHPLKKNIIDICIPIES
ncbi:GyrI-like domain-containing protein [Maribacter algarum]|nr:GyrI-like domain-containing protein [Maribacter algarum]